MGKFRDLTNKRFGRLVAIRRNGVTNDRKVKWLCVCDCGKKKTIAGVSITCGKTRSCGCYEIESKIKKATKHGMADKRFYKIYMGIVKRCNNKVAENYLHYGGRGIKNEWETFEDFRDDMYESYLVHVQKNGERQTTIDRINNDSNYSKENCKWSTYAEQIGNRSNSIRVGGKTLKDFASAIGANYRTVYGWIVKLKLTPKECEERAAKNRRKDARRRARISI